jgi:hypothetical protein
MAIDLPNIRVLLAHTDHHTLMTWTTDDGPESQLGPPLLPQDLREDGTGRIVTGETGLAHTRSIVDNKGGD